MHSDRGVQYASTETREFLEHHGWEASVSRSGNPYDNAWMESAIGKIKNEVLGRSLPADHTAAKHRIRLGEHRADLAGAEERQSGCEGFESVQAA